MQGEPGSPLPPTPPRPRAARTHGGPELSPLPRCRRPELSAQRRRRRQHRYHGLRVRGSSGSRSGPGTPSCRQPRPRRPPRPCHLTSGRRYAGCRCPRTRPRRTTSSQRADRSTERHLFPGAPAQLGRALRHDATEGAWGRRQAPRGPLPSQRHEPCTPTAPPPRAPTPAALPWGPRLPAPTRRNCCPGRVPCGDRNSSHTITFKGSGAENQNEVETGTNPQPTANGVLRAAARSFHVGGKGTVKRRPAVLVTTRMRSLENARFVAGSTRLPQPLQPRTPARGRAPPGHTSRTHTPAASRTGTHVPGGAPPGCGISRPQAATPARSCFGIQEGVRKT